MMDLAHRLTIGLSRRAPDGWQVLRTRVFELATVLWSLPFGLAIVTYFQVVRQPSHVRWALRLWSRGFVTLADRVVGVQHRLEGGELPRDRPVIYVCNHQSYWESIAFTAFVQDLNVVTKAEAMRVPVFGWGLKHAPMVRIDRQRRGSNLRRLIREAKQSIAEGRSVLLFPEGTRIPPGRRAAYLRGLELIYRECGVPIVPVVHNAGHFWTEGFRTKCPGKITVKVLPTIAPGRDAVSTAALIEGLLNNEKDSLPWP